MKKEILNEINRLLSQLEQDPHLPDDDKEVDEGVKNVLEHLKGFIKRQKEGWIDVRDSPPEETSYDINKLTPTPSVNIEDVARVQFASHAKVFDKQRKAVFDWEQFKEVVGIFYGFGKRDSLPEEKPSEDFPTSDEEMAKFLATHPKVEVPEKYKTPNWLFDKQSSEDFKYQEGYKQAEKDLADVAQFSSGPDGFFYGKGYQQAKKDLGWISVKDRLPEKGHFVLTCVADTGTPQCVGMALLLNDGTWWDGDIKVCVDYWMEVPKFNEAKK